MANRLDPDQARRFVGPDPDPTCLQRLSADDTSKQRVKLKIKSYYLFIGRYFFSNLFGVCLYTEVQASTKSNPTQINN